MFAQGCNKGKPRRVAAQTWRPVTPEAMTDEDDFAPTVKCRPQYPYGLALFLQRSYIWGNVRLLTLRSHFAQ